MIIRTARPLFRIPTTVIPTAAFPTTMGDTEQSSGGFGDFGGVVFFKI